MADSRGARCEVGADGKLYMAFAVDGGNHIFRYSPFDISTSVSIVGGDKYHAFYNTKTEPKTFFGRYEPGTGALLKGQLFCGRNSSNYGNTANPEQGEISADASGRVYIVGTSASGIPLSTDPLPGKYTGGAFILIMSPDFTTRELCTRVAEHYTSPGHTVTQRSGKIVMGGKVASDKSFYTKSPIDNSANNTDAFFTVINGSGASSNASPAVTITSPTNNSSFAQGGNISIAATANDSDGTISQVEFFNGPVSLGVDSASPFTATLSNASAGTYNLTAVATDNGGASTASAVVSITVTSTTCTVQNVMLNATVLSKSGEQSGNEADHAFDGSTSTRWSVSGLPTPQFVEVDLGAVYNIEKTELITYEGRAYKFNVQAKKNLGDANTTVVDRSSNTQGGTVSSPIANIFAPVEARYVKLTVTGAAGYSGSWTSINEFRVMNVCTAVPPKTVSAFAKLEAEDFDAQSGLVPNSTGFGYFDSGDWAKYENVDFGTGAASIDVNLATPNSNRSIQLRLDGVSGQLIGTLNIAPTGNWSTYQIRSTAISGATGVHDLYLVGAGGGGVANVDYFVFKTGSTSPGSANPITAYYGGGQYAWTDNIKWNNVANITNYGGVADNSTDNVSAFNSAAAYISSQGGGVVYFPAGSYYFSNDLILPSGVVILGATPASGSSDAKQSSFNLPTKFRFPKYNFVESGSGTSNSTAFKSIKLASATSNSASNVGVVYVDINRATIHLAAADKANATGENTVVFGVRSNNAAIPAPDVPKASVGQLAYQRYNYRFGANIEVYNKKNVLIANTRSNDAVTDNYAYNAYVVDNKGSSMTLTEGKAIFNYTDHYVIVVGQGNGACSAGTPTSCPENFRAGIDIRDNWAYHTMRTAIYARGQGLKVRDNVVRDKSAKTAWVDATGTKLVADNNTLENRGIDWGGWDVSITGNDIQVYRHFLKTGPFYSVDGEGILLQECCGGSTANGLTISDNTANSYIGLYKVRDINDVLISNNTLSTGMTDVSLIYISANTNGANYTIDNTIVEGNDLSGSEASIAFRGSGGPGSGNFIRSNSSTGGIVDYSCDANVSFSANTGFTIGTCKSSTSTRQAATSDAFQEFAHEEVFVYPSPTIGDINLSIPENASATISIRNSIGENVYHLEDYKKGTTIDTSHFLPGLYIVTIKIDDLVTTKKMIVQ